MFSRIGRLIYRQIPSLLKGDRFFKSNRLEEAIYSYTIAIASCRELEREINPDIKESESDFVQTEFSQSILAKLYSNRSAALCNNDQPFTALSDAIQVVSLAPSWPKGYFRVAKAYATAGNIEEGIKYANIARNMPVTAAEFSTIGQFVDILEETKTSENIDKNQNYSNRKAIDSGIYSWGINKDGQLGLGASLVDKSTPAAVVDEIGAKSIIDLACGAVHSVAVTSLGEVYCWGDNQYDQLGTNDHGKSIQKFYSTPTLVHSLLGIPISAVCCGAAHTVCLNSTGHVYAWGKGELIV